MQPANEYCHIWTAQDLASPEFYTLLKDKRTGLVVNVKYSTVALHLPHLPDFKKRFTHITEILVADHMNGVELKLVAANELSSTHMPRVTENGVQISMVSNEEASKYITVRWTWAELYWIYLLLLTCHINGI